MGNVVFRTNLNCWMEQKFYFYRKKVEQYLLHISTEYHENRKLWSFSARLICLHRFSVHVFELFQKFDSVLFQRVYDRKNRKVVVHNTSTLD